MSRRTKKIKEQRPIKIYGRDVAEYNRLKKNTRSKINRVAREYGKNLKDEIPIPKLSEFKTRTEFNEWKNLQRSFTSRSNFDYQFVKNSSGIVRSKTVINQVKRDVKKAQEIADKMIADIEPLPWYSSGTKYSTVKERRLQEARPTTAGIIRPLDFDFDAMKTEKQMNEKELYMAKKASGEYYDERMETLKQNFMELLLKTFNSDAEDLVTMINNVPTDDFYEMYQMFDEFNFEVYYVPKDMETSALDGNIEQMIAYIESYYDGDINLDMKGLFKA